MKLWRGIRHPTDEGAVDIATSQIAPGQPSSRYCRDDIYRFAAGRNQALIYSRTKRTSHLVPTQLVSLLEQCDQFRCLDEHAHRYSRLHGRGSSAPDPATLESVKRQLSELAASGLLIEETELIDRWTASALPAEPLTIDFVGIVTRNRLEKLERCLTSYIASAKNHERKSEYLVMDDSREQAYRDMTREKLRTRAIEHDVRIRYAGLEEKAQFANALVAASGIPARVIDFALFDQENLGCSIGGNRNALLLATVGKLCLSVDDDTECRIVRASPIRSGLTAEPRKDFFNLQCFSSRDSLLEAVAFADADILAIHEQMLGQRLGSCVPPLSDERDRLRFDFVNSRLLRSLEDRTGRVLITFLGLLGDPGVHLPPTLQPLNEISHERLTRSRSEYETACYSRELLKVPASTILSRRGSFVTAAFGFDNRSLLPPFFPLLRGQDGTFGATLHNCFPAGYWGYMPWGILHSPPTTRYYSTTLTRQILSSVRMCNIITALINEFPFSSNTTDEEARLLALGRHLTALGSMKLPDFEEFVRVCLSRAQSAFLSAMERQLRLFSEQPSFWSDDVKESMSVLRNALLGDAYVVPEDLLEQRSMDSARKLTQSLVLSFGELLSSWPAIAGAARNLLAKEITLAAPL